jgi:hypothetical protein
VGRAQADQLLLAIRLGQRDPDRGTPVVLVRRRQRGEQLAVHLAPQERTDARVGRSDRLVEQRSEGHGRRGIGHDRRLPVWSAAVAGGRPLRFQSESLPVGRQHAADRGESSTSCALSVSNRRW